MLLACGIKAQVDGGEAPLALANCNGTLDFDAAVDDHLEGRWVFVYNRLGDPEEATYDIAVDGTIDSRMTFFYLDDLLSERDWDGNGDGIVDRRTFYLYDSTNLLVEERSESGGALTERIAYDYDPERQLHEQTHWKGEGASTLVETGTFSWEDALKASVSWEGPHEASLVTYSYDERLLTREDVYQGQSTLRQRERTTWDEEGRKSQVDKDVNADGQPDYRSSWTYDCF